MVFKNRQNQREERVHDAHLKYAGIRGWSIDGLAPAIGVKQARRTFTGRNFFRVTSVRVRLTAGMYLPA